MITITEEELVSLANAEISTMQSSVSDAKVTSAALEGEVIVLRGEIFTDSYGMPTDKTKLALLLYEEISSKFSTEYTLIESP
ncbi:DUF2498 family protein [Klebsiella pneumoniae]